MSRRERRICELCKTDEGRRRLLLELKKKRLEIASGSWWIVTPGEVRRAGRNALPGAGAAERTPPAHAALRHVGVGSLRREDELATEDMAAPRVESVGR